MGRIPISSFKSIVVDIIHWIDRKLGLVIPTRLHAHNMIKDRVVDGKCGIIRLAKLEHGSSASMHDLAIARYVEIPNTCLTIPSMYC